MPSSLRKGSSTIAVALLYRDAPKAIEWLCRAFGFEKHLVVPGDDGTIVHAELIYGNGMIMLGSARDDDFGKMQKLPQAVGGVVTACMSVIVPDADAHHARAIAAGAQIVRPVEDQHYGGADTGAAISRATSGSSAPTTHGPRRRHSVRPPDAPISPRTM